MERATKRCTVCQAAYDAGHWAHQRGRCPVCGGELRKVASGASAALVYEHYDSSADVQFDLTGLLSADQRRESIVLLSVGLGLVVLAFAARILFVLLGRLPSFWEVPTWFDALVVAMILLGVALLVWSAHRLLQHRRAMRRGSETAS